MSAFVIHTSQFWDGADQNAFDNAVQDYINRMHAFNAVVGKPRPVAIHPLIERAVKRVQTKGKPDTYVADYVVVDDSPPPPSLEDKKNKLMAELLVAEAKAKDGVLHPRKQRLAALR